MIGILMTFKSIQNSRGSLTVFVLLLLGLVLAFVTAFWQLGQAHFTDSFNQWNEAQADQLAESALQEAQYYSSQIDANWEGTSAEVPVTVSGVGIGSYDYTIAISGNTYQITGVGYLPNKTDTKISATRSLTIHQPAVISLFSDNFEANNLNNWTQSNDANVTWTTSNTAPNNGAFHARAYRTNNAGANRWARLLSPILDLSDYSVVVLRLSYRENGNADRILVEVNKTGNVADWVQLYLETVITSTYTRPAIRLEVSASDLSATTQFRISTRLDANEELYLDDVLLSAPISLYNASVDTF